ncbi:hypothetical protein ABK514_000702 [Escherichia coli]|uniref:hypothetical protein n=1 Tax=Enterobacter cloacae TaxID=550 RepID=UPI003294DF8A|nr:hypothetical protein [Enterobacter cloacae]
MSTITKERVAEIIHAAGLEPCDYEEVFGSIKTGEIVAMARIALASLEAEAVGEVVLGEYDDCGCHPDARVVCIAADGQADWENFKDGARLYTAHPAPVSVPDLTALDNLAGEMLNHAMNCERRVAVAYTHCAHRLAEEVRDLRAAMLQGADGNSPAHSGCCPAQNCISPAQCGNLSVIPECSCHACRPVTFADSRFVVCPDCGNKRCPHANDHRNACTGSNEPGQEGSAYPAAPQQEVK